LTSVWTASATLSSLVGLGVGTLNRSAVNSPVSIFTGAALIPDPPISNPNTSIQIPLLSNKNLFRQSNVAKNSLNTFFAVAKIRKQTESFHKTKILPSFIPA
jgi:hypothetical protein